MGGVCIDDTERVVWAAPAIELVKQARDELHGMFGERISIADDPQQRIHVTTIQRLVERGEAYADVTLFISDEAHHDRADRWGEVFSMFPMARCLGLTAWPERRDGRALGDVFDDLVAEVTQEELIRGGHLVPARIFAPRVSVGGDIAMDPVAAYKLFANGEQAIIYAYSVDDAETLARRFRAAGIRSAMLCGETPDAERATEVARFRVGETRVLTNFGLFVEGFDVPSVGAVVLARRFSYVASYLQAVGRARRPRDGKRECRIIDLVGATHRHGSPDVERECSLDGRHIEPRDAGGGGDGYTRYSSVLGIELVEMPPQAPWSAELLQPRSDAEPGFVADPVAEQMRELNERVRRKHGSKLASYVERIERLALKRESLSGAGTSGTARGAENMHETIADAE